jgi:hypothetical protein
MDKLEKDIKELKTLVEKLLILYNNKDETTSK